MDLDWELRSEFSAIALIVPWLTLIESEFGRVVLLVVVVVSRVLLTSKEQDSAAKLHVAFQFSGSTARIDQSQAIHGGTSCGESTSMGCGV